MAYATKKRAGKGAKMCAEGGEVPAVNNEPAMHEDADMIARIMHKRKEYARGGVVANDVGVAEADEAPAEFDDLVLDDHLEGEQPKDSNERGDDVVSKVMKKRK